MTDVINISAGDLCPCFSGKTFGECCESVLNGTKIGATAADVMRARYCAYATGKVEFIISSTHPSKRDECDEKAIAQWSKNSEWTGFEIVSSTQGGENDSAGSVEFVAKFTEDRLKKTLHETAEFIRENGNWYYTDGMVHRPKTFIKSDDDRVNRNDPCPCGSGKKYKKCCMDKK